MRSSCVLLALFVFGCSRGLTPPAERAGGPVAPKQVPVEVAATDGPLFVIGKPVSLGGLAVYPITSKKQTDPGNVIPLEDALKSGAAEVREVGAEANNVPGSEHRDRRQARQGGATVGTLVIENKGDAAVFVIAGTVVKGGNQDRQISQDFVIEGKRTAPVDAFCVEQGRWRNDREGQLTGGKFGSTQIVATSKVRAAGQYKRDQGEVWAKVAETNAAHKKSAATGTFMATLDDGEIVKQRTALAGQIERHVNGVSPASDVVGVAYAIDGQVKGARFFAHNRLFKMFQGKLAQSIALEGITAKAEAQQAGRPAFSGAAPEPAAVESWMKEVEAHAVRESRDTAAANTNEYKESARAYGSKAMMKPKVDPASKAPPAKPMPISADFLAK